MNKEEAIKIVKSHYPANKQMLNEALEFLIPELKEKTDKEIIQELIAVVHLYYGEGINAERDECLKWLDKQKTKPYSGVSFLYNNHTWGMCARDNGVDILYDSKLIKHIKYLQDKTILENLSEQKQEWNKKDENEYNHILKILNLVAEEQETKGYNNLISSIKWFKSFKDRIQSKQSNKPQGKSAIEAIKEENIDNANKIASTDKVEPKFHEGDLVVRKDGREFCEGIKVVQIDKINRVLFQSDCGSSLYNVRLWTVEDAEEGDVLVASDGSIFIFAGVVDCRCKYYAVLTVDNIVSINKEVEYGFWEMSYAVHPASKKQRDTLFAKMREEGYKWDNDKKELKKQLKL